MLAAAKALISVSLMPEVSATAVLARNIVARQDLPPFRASAMDGYAVRSTDLGKGDFHVVGESAAGRSYPHPLNAGETVRIFTGARVPDGANLVVIQEEATAEGGLIRLSPARLDKDNIRQQGCDLSAGTTTLSAGRLLDPAAIGLIAAAGHAYPPVFAPPNVSILCTGSELVAPGSEPSPDQIFESNSPALSALVRKWGGLPHVLTPQADDLAAIAGSVATASDADIIVVVGGASVGDHDLAKPALESLGLSQIFNKIKMRPGKPTWFGRLGDQQLVLGLPGNPASAFVCAHLFLKPLMLALQGADPGPIAPLRAKLSAPLKAEGPREGFLRAKLWVGDDATVWADAALDQDSSLTSVLAAANGCIRRATAAPAAKAGAIVEAFLFEGRGL